MKKVSVLLALIILAIAANCASAAKLDVGSKAPAMKVMKWIKGQPVTKFVPGKIYVVEFWASWCPPCRESIPHITGLAKKYKGKVTFAGISVWDTRDVKTKAEYISKRTKFVKDQGAKMDYNVGLDYMEGSMVKLWLEPAGVQGIPTAFIIGKDGKIAFIGHPMEMDDVLKQMVAGKYDVKAEAAKRAAQEKADALMAKPYQLLEQGQYKESVEEFDKLLASDPKLESTIAMPKVYAMLFVDQPGAYAYAKKSAEGVYKNDPDSQAMIASLLAGIVPMKMPDQSTPDYAAALAMAQQASALAKENNPYVLDTVAAIYDKMGDFSKAAECQQQALTAAESDKEMNQAFRDQMQQKLAGYKAKQPQ